MVTEYSAPEPDFMARFHKIDKTELTPEIVLETVAFSPASHNGEH